MDEDIPFAKELFDPESLSRFLGGAKLSHALGQNLLTDPSVVSSIVRALGEIGDATVVEIGSGAGTLTYTLCHLARHVVAIEFDPSMAGRLKLTLSDLHNWTLLQENALETRYEEFQKPWIAAGNIPYQITGALIQRLLDTRPSPERIVFLMQEEVAKRLAAPPGDWGLSTVAVRLSGIPELVGNRVPATSFVPPPTVSSRVLAITPADLYPEEVKRSVLSLAKPVFQFRRKTLTNALSALYGKERARHLLAATGIEGERRAQTLSLEEWVHLAGNVREL